MNEALRLSALALFAVGPVTGAGITGLAPIDLLTCSEAGRTQMDRRRLLIAGFVVGAATVSWQLLRHWRDYGADVEHSGESFPLGNLQVIVDYGYSEGGDRLRYMVIRAYAANSTVAERVADPRYDINSGSVPWVRHADGTMRPVKTDGRVYLFIGDELRMMRVDMNEHTDTIGLSRAGNLDRMWDYLQQFRVPGAD